MGYISPIICNKKSSMGIGAMIIFIAMVLVAGIAASVLVQTANRLETQAMVTGSETTGEVSTGLRVVNIDGKKALVNMAYNTSTGLLWNYSGRQDGDISFRGWHNYTRIHYMVITVGPRAGSRDIDLSTTVVELSNTSAKCLLTYDSNNFQGSTSSSGVFNTNAFSLGPDKFGVIELEDADNSCSASTPAINRGDKVMVTVNLSASFFGLPERTDVWGMIIPEEGISGVFIFRTPLSYIDTVYKLY